MFKYGEAPEGFMPYDYPQGDGYATGSIKSDGTVSIAGKLADHTAFTASAPLSQELYWPLFASLYNKKGSFSAWMQVDTSPSSETDMEGSDVYWFRPFQPVQWFTYGWTEGLEVEIIGSQYTPPPASVFPGLNPVDPMNGNVELLFSDGQLSAPLSKSLNINPSNAVSKVPSTDASFSCNLTTGSGMLSGSFTHSDGTKPAWQGVLFQKAGANRGGYGYFMTTKPKVLDYYGESGSVSLQAK